MASPVANALAAHFATPPKPGTTAWDDLHAQELAGDKIAAENTAAAKARAAAAPPVPPAANPTVSGATGSTPSLATPSAAPPVKGTPAWTALHNKEVMADRGPAWNALHAKELAGDKVAASNEQRALAAARAAPGYVAPGQPTGTVNGQTFAQYNAARPGSSTAENEKSFLAQRPASNTTANIQHAETVDQTTNNPPLTQAQLNAAWAANPTDAQAQATGAGILNAATGDTTTYTPGTDYATTSAPPPVSADVTKNTVQLPDGSYAVVDQNGNVVDTADLGSLGQTWGQALLNNATTGSADTAANTATLRDMYNTDSGAGRGLSGMDAQSSETQNAAYLNQLAGLDVANNAATTAYDTGGAQAAAAYNSGQQGQVSAAGQAEEQAKQTTPASYMNDVLDPGTATAAEYPTMGAYASAEAGRMPVPTALESYYQNIERQPGAKPITAAQWKAIADANGANYGSATLAKSYAMLPAAERAGTASAANAAARA